MKRSCASATAERAGRDNLLARLAQAGDAKSAERNSQFENEI
jgi:hypothetical protein